MKIGIEIGGTFCSDKPIYMAARRELGGIVSPFLHTTRNTCALISCIRVLVALL